MAIATPTPDTDRTDHSRFVAGLVRRNPGEPEFHQAVEEVAESVLPVVCQNPAYVSARILERLAEPDRIVTFRVVWEDDQGNVRVNRAWRVQCSNALGPYKGGLRFHPTVTASVLKFLAFEQVFKNSLTGLPMGGAKGGSNFNPRGKSDREVMRFCHALMIELHRHIGEDTDVPAGDIGVGGREIGYLYGTYKHLENRVAGVLTGKGLNFGGSLVRTEATGYGCVYFCEEVLRHHGASISGLTVAISGSGNVAIFAAQKAAELGARVVTLSDSDGFVHAPAGIGATTLDAVKQLKLVRRGRIGELAEEVEGVSYHPGQTPWSVPCDVAIPCATENELDDEAARRLVVGGTQLVAEGANMPVTAEAVRVLQAADVLFAPAKAANAGGVAVSGLEQSQNAQRLSWTHEEVDARLKSIMRAIHDSCVQHGGEGDVVDYRRGANVAGFIRVADAMLAHGLA